MVRAEGRILPPPTLLWGGGYYETARGDWARTASNKPLLQSSSFEKWAVIFNNKMSTPAFNKLKDGLRGSAVKLGMKLSPPKVVNVESDRLDAWVRVVKGIPQDCQLLVLIFNGPPRADRYAAVKKICCIERPMPSQVIMQKTLLKTNISSICTKILLQMSCKIGAEPWGVKLDQSSLMVVGIHVSPNFTTLVATTNQTFGQFFSAVCDHKLNNQSVASLLTKALECYKGRNDQQEPKKVLLYSNCWSFSQELLQDKPFDLTCVTVNRKPIAKMLSLKDWGSSTYENPPAGTVLDQLVTSGDDFYLVPMCPSAGTVTPTHFLVKEWGTMSVNSIQQTSYGLTHMYFNWSGAIRVPAPVQYAQKLNDLVSSHLHTAPSEKLSDTLFYL